MEYTRIRMVLRGKPSEPLTLVPDRFFTLGLVLSGSKYIPTLCWRLLTIIVQSPILVFEAPSYSIFGEFAGSEAWMIMTELVLGLRSQSFP